MSSMMTLLDRTLDSPAANVACDEALFLECERTGGDGVLRFWEPDRTFVVVGYTNAVDREVHGDACRSLNIPILRRCTGGGTVVQMPGCLNFTLVLPYALDSAFATIGSTNRSVMETLRGAFTTLLHGESVTVEGISDLARNGMKFCGNAQRRGESCLLFHGVVLCNAELQWITRLLPLPSRQPGYRQNRSHASFLTNVNLPIAALKSAIATTWSAAPRPFEIPRDVIQQLVDTKYTQDLWNFKR